MDLATTLALDWWRRNPWRPVGEVLAQEAGGHLLPVIRRHPVACVVGAATLGAALVTLVSWRWKNVSKPLLRAPVHIGGWLVSQLAQPALQTALLIKLMAWLQGTPAGTPAADGAPASGPETGPDTRTDTRPDAADAAPPDATPHRPFTGNGATAPDDGRGPHAINSN